MSIISRNLFAFWFTFKWHFDRGLCGRPLPVPRPVCLHSHGRSRCSRLAQGWTIPQLHHICHVVYTRLDIFVCNQYSLFCFSGRLQPALPDQQSTLHPGNAHQLVPGREPGIKNILVSTLEIFLRILITRSLGALRPQLRASLTSSIAPFGRSGRVTQNLSHMLMCVRAR